MTSPFYYFAPHSKQFRNIPDPSPHVLSPFPEQTATQKSWSAVVRDRDDSSVGHKSECPLHFSPAAKANRAVFAVQGSCRG